MCRKLLCHRQQSIVLFILNTKSDKIMSQYSEQTRWLMVIFHHSGMTIPEVAEALGFDERTVERWIARFNDTLSITA